MYARACNGTIILGIIYSKWLQLTISSSVDKTITPGSQSRFYTFCRLMRRRIKVADPRIFLIFAAYIHIREEVVDDNDIIIGSQRPPAKRTRCFACLEETQSGGFAWLAVANRALPYRSSSNIILYSYMRHPSPKRTAAGIYPT